MTLRIAAGVVGLLVAALGVLWFGQGTGLVHLDPIACVGTCTPVEAPSLPWTLAGVAAFIVGVGGVRWALRRGGRP